MNDEPLWLADRIAFKTSADILREPKFEPLTSSSSGEEFSDEDIEQAPNNTPVQIPYPVKANLVTSPIQSKVYEKRRRARGSLLFDSSSSESEDEEIDYERSVIDVKLTQVIHGLEGYKSVQVQNKEQKTKSAELPSIPITNKTLLNAAQSPQKQNILETVNGNIIVNNDKTDAVKKGDIDVNDNKQNLLNSEVNLPLVKGKRKRNAKDLGRVDQKKRHIPSAKRLSIEGNQRKRGRPKKSVSQEESELLSLPSPEESSVDDLPSVITSAKQLSTEGTKRRKGRPKKSASQEESLSLPSLEESGADDLPSVLTSAKQLPTEDTQRKKGRPKKSETQKESELLSLPSPEESGADDLPSVIADETELTGKVSGRTRTTRKKTLEVAYSGIDQIAANIEDLSPQLPVVIKASKKQSSASDNNQTLERTGKKDESEVVLDKEQKVVEKLLPLQGSHFTRLRGNKDKNRSQPVEAGEKLHEFLDNNTDYNRQTEETVECDYDLSVKSEGKNKQTVDKSQVEDSVKDTAEFLKTLKSDLVIKRNRGTHNLRKKAIFSEVPHKWMKSSLGVVKQLHQHCKNIKSPKNQTENKDSKQVVFGEQVEVFDTCNPVTKRQLISAGIDVETSVDIRLQSQIVRDSALSQVLENDVNKEVESIHCKEVSQSRSKEITPAVKEIDLEFQETVENDSEVDSQVRDTTKNLQNIVVDSEDIVNNDGLTVNCQVSEVLENVQSIKGENQENINHFEKNSIETVGNQTSVREIHPLSSPIGKSSKLDSPIGKSSKLDSPIGKSSKLDSPFGKSSKLDSPIGKSSKLDSPIGKNSKQDLQEKESLVKNIYTDIQKKEALVKALYQEIQEKHALVKEIYTQISEQVKPVVLAGEGLTETSNQITEVISENSAVEGFVESWKVENSESVVAGEGLTETSNQITEVIRENSAVEGFVESGKVENSESVVAGEGLTETSNQITEVIRENSAVEGFVESGKVANSESVVAGEGLTETSNQISEFSSENSAVKGLVESVGNCESEALINLGFGSEFNTESNSCEIVNSAVQPEDNSRSSAPNKDITVTSKQSVIKNSGVTPILAPKLSVVQEKRKSLRFPEKDTVRGSENHSDSVGNSETLARKTRSVISHNRSSGRPQDINSSEIVRRTRSKSIDREKQDTTKLNTPASVKPVEKVCDIGDIAPVRVTRSTGSNPVKPAESNSTGFKATFSGSTPEKESDLTVEQTPFSSYTKDKSEKCSSQDKNKTFSFDNKPSEEGGNSFEATSKETSNKTGVALIETRRGTRSRKATLEYIVNNLQDSVTKSTNTNSKLTATSSTKDLDKQHNSADITEHPISVKILDFSSGAEDISSLDNLFSAEEDHYSNSELIEGKGQSQSNTDLEQVRSGESKGAVDVTEVEYSCDQKLEVRKTRSGKVIGGHNTDTNSENTVSEVTVNDKREAVGEFTLNNEVKYKEEAVTEDSDHINKEEEEEQDIILQKFLGYCPQEIQNTQKFILRDNQAAEEADISDSDCSEDSYQSSVPSDFYSSHILGQLSFSRSAEPVSSEITQVPAPLKEETSQEKNMDDHLIKSEDNESEGEGYDITSALLLPPVTESSLGIRTSPRKSMRKLSDIMDVGMSDDDDLSVLSVKKRKKPKRKVVKKTPDVPQLVDMPEAAEAAEATIAEVKVEESTSEKATTKRKGRKRRKSEDGDDDEDYTPIVSRKASVSRAPRIPSKSSSISIRDLPAGTPVLKRSRRCMECEACLRKTTCGECKFCVNKSYKKACIKKQCSNLTKVPSLKHKPAKKSPGHGETQVSVQVKSRKKPTPQAAKDEDEEEEEEEDDVGDGVGDLLGLMPMGMSVKMEDTEPVDSGEVVQLEAEQEETEQPSSSTDKVRFEFTKRGKRIMVYRGYKYIAKRTTSRITWHCEKRRSTKAPDNCLASLTTDLEGGDIRLGQPHNHECDQESEEVPEVADTSLEQQQVTTHLIEDSPKEEKLFVNVVDVQGLVQEMEEQEELEPDIEEQGESRYVNPEDLQKSNAAAPEGSVTCDLCGVLVESKDKLIGHLYKHFSEEKTGADDDELEESKGSEMAGPSEGSGSKVAVDTSGSESNTENSGLPRAKLLTHKFKKPTSAIASNVTVIPSPAQGVQLITTESLVASKNSSPRKKKVLQKQTKLLYESSSDAESDQNEVHKEETSVSTSSSASFVNQADDQTLLMCPYCDTTCQSQPGLRAHVTIYHHQKKSIVAAGKVQPKASGASVSLLPIAPQLSTPASRSGPYISPRQIQILSRPHPQTTTQQPTVTMGRNLTFQQPGAQVTAASVPTTVGPPGHSISFIGSSDNSMMNQTTGVTIKKHKSAAAQSAAAVSSIQQAMPAAAVLQQIQPAQQQQQGIFLVQGPAGNPVQATGIAGAATPITVNINGQQQQFFLQGSNLIPAAQAVSQQQSVVLIQGGNAVAGGGNLILGTSGTGQPQLLLQGNQQGIIMQQPQLGRSTGVSLLPTSSANKQATRLTQAAVNQHMGVVIQNSGAANIPGGLNISKVVGNTGTVPAQNKRMLPRSVVATAGTSSSKTPEKDGDLASYLTQSNTQQVEYVDSSAIMSVTPLYKSSQQKQQQQQQPQQQPPTQWLEPQVDLTKSPVKSTAPTITTTLTQQQHQQLQQGSAKIITTSQGLLLLQHNASKPVESNSPSEAIEIPDSPEHTAGAAGDMVISNVTSLEDQVGENEQLDGNSECKDTTTQFDGQGDYKDEPQKNIPPNGSSSVDEVPIPDDCQTVKIKIFNSPSCSGSDGENDVSSTSDGFSGENGEIDPQKPQREGEIRIYLG